MAIRLRVVEGTLIAICAARSIEKPGDIYLDDGAHHALIDKFAEDFGTEGYNTRSLDPVAARLRAQEESNNPNRAWWDSTHASSSVEPSAPSSARNEARTLADYRPQHDERCEIHKCRECGHWRGDPTMHGYGDQCDEWHSLPCSCGLEQLLAAVQGQSVEPSAPQERTDQGAAREVDDATKLGDFLRRAITGEDQSALAEAIRAWNDENDRRHDAEDRVRELETELAAIGVAHAALARDFNRAIEFRVELVQQLKYVARSCPCGARSESLQTHPHVPWCPIAEVIASAPVAGDASGSEKEPS